MNWAGVPERRGSDMGGGIEGDGIRVGLLLLAEGAPESDGMFGAVERRAHRVRARRTAAAGAAAIAIGVLAVVAAPEAFSSKSHDGTAGVAIAGGHANSSPDAASSGPMVWPSLSGQPDADWINNTAVADSMRGQLADSSAAVTDLRVLWTGDTDGGEAAVVAGQAAGRVAVAAVVRDQDPGAAQDVHAVNASAQQVSVVAHVRAESGPVDDGIVVAAPGSWAIDVQFPGTTTWIPAERVAGDSRVAVVTLGRVQSGDWPRLRLTRGSTILMGLLGFDDTATS